MICGFYTNSNILYKICIILEVKFLHISQNTCLRSKVTAHKFIFLHFYAYFAISTYLCQNMIFLFKKPVSKGNKLYKLELFLP